MLLEENGRTLLLQPLQKHDAQAFMQLQQTVHDAMPFPEHYVAATWEDLTAMLEKHYVYGAFEDGRLMAAATCIRNTDSPYNLGQKCGEDPAACYTYDAVFVHPDCRGMGLQRVFAEMILGQAVKDGAKSVWCTVSPENRYSYDNVLKAGFHPYRTGVRMYGGRVRDILKLEL